MDQHEKNIKKSIDLNIIGTSNITKMCEINNIKLIYFSTGYVYPCKKGNYLDQIAYNKQAIKVRKPLIAAPTLNQNYFQITEGKYTLKLDLELFSDIKIHLKILSNLAQHTMLSEILTIKKWNKNISRDFEIYSNLEQNMEIQIFELDTKNKYNLNGYEVIKND